MIFLLSDPCQYVAPTFLQQWFSNFNLHCGHVEGLVKCWILGFTSRVSSYVALWWDWRTYISNNFPKWQGYCPRNNFITSTLQKLLLTPARWQKWKEGLEVLLVGYLSFAPLCLSPSFSMVGLHQRASLITGIQFGLTMRNMSKQWEGEKRERLDILSSPSGTAVSRVCPQSKF